MKQVHVGSSGGIFLREETVTLHYRHRIFNGTLICRDYLYIASAERTGNK
jgi:hypothetical protein